MQDDLIERNNAWPAAMGRGDALSVDFVSALLAENSDRIAALEAELAIAQDYKDCGCSYDHPNDLCLGHEKLFKRLTDKRIAALEAENARLMGLVKEAEEALSNYACHAGPDIPCIRSKFQCLADCGKIAGDALAKIKEATDGRVTD